MTRAEQESILRWDEHEKIVFIWTASPVTYRKLEKAGLVPTEETHAKRTGELTGRFYRVPLAGFGWRIKPPRTAAQVEASRQTAQRLRERQGSRGRKTANPSNPSPVPAMVPANEGEEA
jgi:hypothetical protein